MRTLNILILTFFAVFNLSAQEPGNLIQGRVSDAESGAPLAGVNIDLPGTSERTLTDENGLYQLNFTGKQVWLLASLPGYLTYETRAQAGRTYDFVMIAEGIRSPRSQVMGPFGDNMLYKNASFDYVDRQSIRYTGQVSPDLAIQGRLSGMHAKSVSGMPGEGGNLTIRGISSIFAHKAPLILLDGVPINTRMIENGVNSGLFYNPLKGIDVNDIASVDILRDGGSLFGVTGGNGVIMINTVQPLSVETRIDFSAQSGLTSTPGYLNMMSGTEHKTYLINQLQNTGIPYDDMLRQNPWISGNPSYFLYYNHANNTNWQDEVFRVARATKFNASLQGGDEIARFAVLLGYLNQQGVIANSGYQRFNFRFNADVQILSRLTMVSNIAFSYHDTELRDAGINAGLNPITAALLKSPMYAPYLRDQQGNRIAVQSNADSFGFSNPATIVDKAIGQTNESQMFGNIRLTYDLGGSYTLSNQFNASFDNRKENTFIPDYGIIEFNEGEVSNFAREGMLKLNSFYNETSFNYRRQIALTHFFTGQTGLRMSSQHEKYNKGSVFNTPTDEFRSLSSVTSIANTLIEGYSNVSNRSDLFLRSGYRYLNKYMVDVVMTLSGSSNAGSQADAISLLGGKWGFFPSLHGSWLISNEDFMTNSKAINMLKIRASISRSGNDFFSSYHRYDYASRPYGRNSGIVRSYIPNKKLKWEEITQLNAGIDGAFFHERLMLSLDAYQRTTNDLLSYRQVSVESGFEHFWENNGSLIARGTEISAHMRALTGAFSLSVGGNLNLSSTQVSTPSDLIMDVPGGHVIIRDGSHALSFYGYKTQGILENASDVEAAGLENAYGIPFRPGDMHFADKDNNKIIDSNDRFDLGSLYPNITGGAYIDMKYKNLSVNVLVDFSQGNSIFNYTRMLTESLSGYGNQSISALYSWKNDNDQTTIPRIDNGDMAGNARFSDRWIEDGSFIRLKEVSIAYKLPDAGIYKNLTIYVSGQNLFISNSYLGYSPDFSYSSSPVLQGIDYAQTPVTPFFAAGIKLGL